LTDPRPVAPLPRPTPAAEPGPLDERLYDLVEARFDRLIRDNPVLGTSLGLHRDDDLLGDGSREALLAELAADRTHLAEVEALDPVGLSPEALFERDLELHNVRRAIFDTDVLRIWERRSFALDVIGDSLFLLFVRDHAPLPERLETISGRLEAIATYLEEAKTRATVPQVRLWQEVELETAAGLPVFFDEIVAAGTGVLEPADRRRLERASETAKLAVELYATWLEGTLPGGTDEWAVGANDRTPWWGCAASTASAPTRSSNSDGSTWSRSTLRVRPSRARSIQVATSRPPSIRSSQTNPRRSRPRSTPIATRCFERAGTSSSAT